MSDAGLPTLATIEAELDGIDRNGLARFRIAVLANITVEPLASYLRWLALAEGLDAEIRTADFGAVVSEALAERSPLLADADCVVVFAHISALAPDLLEAFSSLDVETVQERCDWVQETVTAVIEGVRRQTNALILWYGQETPLHPAYGILDDGRPWGQSDVLRRINAHAGEVLMATPNAFFIDVDRIRALLGAERFHDPRLWHIARAPFGRPAIAALATHALPHIRAIRGGAKKCLVLDCDNTLWGGIVGEDGPHGIALGHEYPGSAYRAFQQQVLNLHRRGVILALCSRNNEDDIWQVFDHHHEMVLKREHIAAARINWQDKAGNIEALARELGIGLEHVVFADDSEYEIGMIATMLPQVATLHVPADRAAASADLLAGCRLFETLTLSAEDRRRGEMYRSEVQRSIARDKTANVEDYLRSLGLRVHIAAADSSSVARVAQLTQKTNQFNLTTRRYGEAEVEALIQDPDVDVLCCRVSDRFGDYGAVGVGIVRHDEGVSEIDTLLMSCRVLGRGVETCLLRGCIEASRRRHCACVRGVFIPTKKNEQVRDFYERLGFRSDRHDEQQWFFSFEGAAPLPPIPNHVSFGVEAAVREGD